jgi:dienelactone hydrolase
MGRVRGGAALGLLGPLIPLLLSAALVVGAGSEAPGTAIAAPPPLPEFPRFPPPLRSLADGRAGEIFFASSSPYDLEVLLGDSSVAQPTTAVGTLVLPAGASRSARAPALVILHGSGGITPGREMTYARRLAERGYASLVIDYFRARGVGSSTPYMARVAAVTEFDIAADAYAALRLLGSHPAIDPERIGVIGFSYGGMAARIALDERIHRALGRGAPPFAAHVDYYGPCHFDLGTERTTGAPLLTLRGGQDDSNDLEACARTEMALRRAGSPVDALVFSGAGHAWEADLPRKRSDSPYLRCTIRYDARGRGSIGGAALASAGPTATRAERYALRAAGVGQLGECVGRGYVIGRDDATRARSDRALLEFLERSLGGRPTR